ncbi:hypothetical protein FRC19_011896 [Serendipita sp. 401]|nr:hypothetical protein FRC19_011896 [Serendipita sp. 401]
MLALLRAGSRLAPKSLAPPFLGQKPRRMAYKPLYMEKPRPLTSQDGPLVWIDCEMTGLDFKKHKLLEIAVIITNGDLKRVDKGIDYVIRTDKADLDQMDEWCTRTHGETGLTKACLESENGHDWVESTVLEYIKKWVPTQRTAILAGSSVHFDRAFLAEHMPSLTDWLHYRIVDVSSVKSKRELGDHQKVVPKNKAELRRVYRRGNVA